jgi:hypothetical protein
MHMAGFKPVVLLRGLPMAVRTSRYNYNGSEKKVLGAIHVNKDVTVGIANENLRLRGILRE